MNAWLGIAVVLFALGTLMGALKCVPLPPELSRKAVHVGMGLICLSFPWVFSEKWPVALLAVLAIAGLAAIRLVPALRSRIGSVLGGVERQSLGEFYFPAAVAIVFYLSGSDTLLYVIPVLTLTIADSVGALVGIRYGLSPYRTDDGLKSAEGSVAFFTAAFLSCHIPLLLFSQTGREETLLIGLTAGFVVMLLEAIAWRGQDNLVIPLGMFLLLRLFLPLDMNELLLRFAVIAALVVLVFIWRTRTTLSDSAVLAAALSGYAVWAFGGWIWLAAPLLLFFVYIGLPSFPAAERPIQDFRAVTHVMAGGFLWLIVAQLSERPKFLAPFLLCLAAHTGNIMTARLRIVRPGMTMKTVFAIAWVAPSVLFGALACTAVIFHQLSWSAVALMPISVAISIAFFVPAWPLVHTPENKLRVWLSETCIAILASFPGIWIALNP